jgi:hypothetical protein
VRVVVRSALRRLVFGLTAGAVFLAWQRSQRSIGACWWA